MKRTPTSFFVHLVAMCLLCSICLAGCSRQDTTKTAPITSDRYQKLLAVYDQSETVLSFDGTPVTWQEYCYAVAYHVAYVDDSRGTVKNWNETLTGETTYGEYVLENAEKWLLYNAALTRGAKETGIALDASDEKEVLKQWEEAVKTAGSEEALLREMSTYCCNKELYLSMLRTRALSEKVFEALYGDAKEDLDANSAFEEKLADWSKAVKVEHRKDLSGLDLQKLLN